MLLLRLAQVQLVWDVKLDPEVHSRIGGSHLVDTVRGGIYTQWGTPLAVQTPSFDLAVYYDQLLLVVADPWRFHRFQEVLDGFVSSDGPAGHGDDWIWDRYARPLRRGASAGPPPAEATGMDRHEYLWSVRSVESRRHGTLEQYARRRLSRERDRDIRSGPPLSGATQDWRAVVTDLTGISGDGLSARAEDVLMRVERIENSVRRRLKDSTIRVAERYDYHRVADDVPAEVAAALRTEPGRLPAIRSRDGTAPALRVVESARRRNPNSTLAPHLIGLERRIVAETWASLSERDLTWTRAQGLAAIGSLYRMDDRIGISGAERAFEGVLRGRRGHVVKHREFGLLSYRDVSEVTPPECGRDVYLTIREDFQQAANDALAWADDRPEMDFHAGALVIVDVRDGAVLAAATYPTYDLADYGKRYNELLAREHSPLIFRPFQAALPTGSVYKIITTIAALEEGAITPQTTFDCRKRQEFRAGRARRYFHCEGLHRTLDLLPAIERSCNIYFYNTGLRSGGEALARWGQEFGLGARTGIEVGEKGGQVPTPSYTYGVLNLCIGQGELLATPLQVACMAAAVANGGRLYKPHLLDHVRDPGGVVERYEPSFRQVPVKESTLRVLREGLRRVVEGPKGTARDSMMTRLGLTPLREFRVAGKTGTAELGEGRPNHAWFVGYAPHDDPKIAFAVVNERTATGHGGTHAAPIMAMVLERIWDEVEQMP